MDTRCSMMVNQMADVSHLNARDTTAGQEQVRRAVDLGLLQG